MTTTVKTRKSRKTKPAAGAGPARRAKPVEPAARKAVQVAPDAAANNAALLARREAAVARGVASAAPIFAAKAENAGNQRDNEKYKCPIKH